MASSKFHVVFFLAITLIAAVMPQPSAAVRVEPPTSSTAGAQPSKWHNLIRALPSCIWPLIPPIFGPPTPSAPVPPTPSKPQPKECLPSLMGLMPCKDFITNITAPEPPYPGKCCDGAKSLFKDAAICLCHFDNGDIEKLMGAPIDGGNFLGLVTICHSEPSDIGSCDGPVPPMRAAPTPEAAP